MHIVHWTRSGTYTHMYMYTNKFANQKHANEPYIKKNEPFISTIFGWVRPVGCFYYITIPREVQLLFLILIQPEISEDVLCQAWNF